jgi:hypothetical protein
MRLIVLAAAAALLSSQPALAAWKEYTYPELGFVVAFPADPSTSTGIYTSVLVDKAPTHIFTLKEGNSIFTATVVDMMGHKEEGASLMGEAEFLMHLLGDTKGNSTSRVEPGKAAVYGRQITIDIRDGVIPEQAGQTDAAHKWFKAATGMEIPTGSRLTTNLFFNRGRLYMIQGINLPAQGDAGGPEAVRFAESLSFMQPDGKRNGADDPARPAQ